MATAYNVAHYSRHAETQFVHSSSPKITGPQNATPHSFPHYSPFLENKAEFCSQLSHPLGNACPIRATSGHCGFKDASDHAFAVAG